MFRPSVERATSFQGGFSFLLWFLWYWLVAAAVVLYNSRENKNQEREYKTKEMEEDFREYKTAEREFI